MKLRSLVVAVVLALAVVLAPAAARAQGAVYLNPIATRVSNSTVDNSQFSFLGQNSTSRMFYGVVFGGYYDIPTNSRTVEVGVDLRDAVLHGNNALLNSFQLGPRIAFWPTTHRLHPYVEPFIGVGTTRAPHTQATVGKLTYGVMGGADYELGRHVNFRVFEVGYSSLVTASNNTLGNTGTGFPAAKLVTISSGLTFRLPQWGRSRR